MFYYEWWHQPLHTKLKLAREEEKGVDPSQHEVIQKLWIIRRLWMVLIMGDVNFNMVNAPSQMKIALGYGVWTPHPCEV